MARILARSVSGLRFSGMRKGEGAESPPYSVLRKDQPPQAQIVWGCDEGWRMKYVLQELDYWTEMHERTMGAYWSWIKTVSGPNR